MNENDSELTYEYLPEAFCIDRSIDEDEIVFGAKKIH
jgi:hypothetical protein